MAGMTTVLTPFDTGKPNGRTYTLDTHTVAKPRLCVQKRRVPAGNQKVAEDSVFIMSGSEDADGNPIPERSSVEIVVRRSIEADTADLSVVLAAAIDIIASDEFSNTVDTQEYLG